MKKLFVFALIFTSMTLGSSIISNAQTALPYSNGFDTQAENDDWTVYRKGLTTINGYPSHTWEPAPSPGAATAPNIEFHDYPVGYTGEELTDDWLVLKNLDFAQGAKISLKLWIYAIAGVYPGDTAQLYLLSGNPDPALATKTLLASLTYMATSSGSANNPEWKDTVDIIIPPVSADAYIAFRYTTIQNWFTVALDDIEITTDSTTPPPSGIDKIAATFSSLQLYPNPATTTLFWSYSSNTTIQKTGIGQLVDITGKILATFPVKAGQLDIKSLNAGLYFIKTDDCIQPFLKK